MSDSVQLKHRYLKDAMFSASFIGFLVLVIGFMLYTGTGGAGRVAVIVIVSIATWWFLSLFLVTLREGLFSKEEE